MRPQSDKDFDVAVLGAGVAGSLLACILAKHGVRVILLDAFHHPRFAVGESMVSETRHYLNLIARRFNLPEATYLTHAKLLCERLASTSGVKLNFGFVHNRENERNSADTMTMVPLLSPEAHLYRQDVDYFFFAQAIHYGADARQGVQVKDVDLKSNGVTLTTATGEKIKVDFLVDASGYRSPLAEKLGLRADPETIETHARSLFTHMVDVLPYEQSIMRKSEHGLPVNFFQGTLHHIFKGGWLWVIPFNNHRWSTNTLCSVGLQLDPRIYGPPQEPEKEFKQFLERYPSIAQQFRSARRVREWVVAPRLQYKSTHSAGDRYCLLAHASGFIDPLYSRGLVISFEAVNNLAPKLLEAVRTGEFYQEKFEPVAKIMQAATDYNDQLVASSYSSFHDWDLWNAWHRVWIHAAYLGAGRVKKILATYDEKDDAATTRKFENQPLLGSISKGYAPFEELFTSSVNLVRDAHHGRRSPSEVSAAIFKMITDLESRNVLPPHGMSNPSKRWPVFPEPDDIRRLLVWGKLEAPEDLRETHFGLDPVMPDVGAEMRLDLG